MNYFTELLIKTFVETVYLTGMIILVGLLLGVLRTNSIKNFQRSFGSKAVMITGVIGVPIHELSHAIFALLFGHRITEIKLFQKPNENGVMGYVKHTYDPRSVYAQIGNFFIGVAPIFGGIISIVVLMRFIIPQSYNKFIEIIINNFHVSALNKAIIEGILSSNMGLIKTIFSLRNFENPYFYIFLFMAICISSHISLSSADIKGALRGLGVIFIAILILNSLGLAKYVSLLDIIKYNVLITGFLTVAVILSVVTFLVSLVLRIIKS